MTLLTRLGFTWPVATTEAKGEVEDATEKRRGKGRVRGNGVVKDQCINQSSMTHLRALHLFCWPSGYKAEAQPLPATSDIGTVEL